MFAIGVLPAFLLLYARRGVHEPTLWLASDGNRRQARHRLEIGIGSELDRELTQFTTTRILSDPDLRRRVGSLLLMSISSVVGWWSASTWTPQYAAELAARAGQRLPLSPSLVALLFGSGTIAGYIVLGFLADIIGRKPVIWLYYLKYYLGALILSLGLFLLANTRPALLILAAANGFFASGQFSWMTIYLPELFPTRLRGSATSLVFDTSRSIVALGPLSAGWLISSFGGIGTAAAIMSLVYVIGLLVTVCRTRDEGRAPALVTVRHPTRQPYPSFCWTASRHLSVTVSARMAH
jgi:MFS family permease